MPKEDKQSRVTASMNQAVENYDAIGRSKGSFLGRTFLDMNTNMSVKSDYSRQDYDLYRPGEAVPKQQEDIIRMCMKAYDTVGIVHNVIDLMSDFGMQGVRIVHPQKSQQNFYDEWWNYIDGSHVSERFLNYLYRTANVIVKRRFGKVPTKYFKKWKSAGSLEDVEIQEGKTVKRVIPLEYNFLNPLAIEIVGGELAMFIGKPIYALKLTQSVRKMIDDLNRVTQNHRYESKLIQQLPDDILNAFKAGQRVFVLEPDKVDAYHYKKDDWLPWANPMIYSILNSLIMLEKMHLADVSALDGAISNIRLWRLGVLDPSNPANSIMPTRAAINKLKNILHNNIAGGVIDLVWGPELDFKESSTNVHYFLGPEKYQQVMTEIYAGLGIPPTLTGSSNASGFTNNYISMKTLIERLRYGRIILTRFWNNELRKVQRAMGFDKPAQIIFDDLVLSDEATAQNLILELIDRDIISAESALERLNYIPEVEKVRIQKEQKERISGKMAPKAGQFHNPQTDDDLKKIVLQGGGVAPSEVGLNLKERKPGEKSRHEQQEEMQTRISDKFKPKFPNGRPDGKKDSTKRKRKIVKPRTSANFIDTFIWANEAQKSIAEITTPAFLHALGKKNVRSLTSDEKEQVEYLRLSILSNIEPYSKITQEKVYSILSNALPVDSEIVTMCKTLAYRFMQLNDREPNIDEIKQIQASAYALRYEEDGENVSQDNVVMES